jgi:hypothetical protein
MMWIHGFVFCKYNISLPCIFKRWETMLFPQSLMQEWQETGGNILFMTRHTLSVLHRERWRFLISGYPRVLFHIDHHVAMRSGSISGKSFQEINPFSWDTFGVLAPWSAIRLTGFGIEPCNRHWDLWFYGETDSERCTWRRCFCGDSFS